jgi:hypothetical protein
VYKRQPEILTFNTTQSNGSIKRQSFLAFTSGHKYDNRSGRYPHLFLLKISNDTNALGKGIKNGNTWRLGQDYFKVKITDAASGFNNPDDNGFTAPQSFTFNQKVLATYFGDLYGNLWKVQDLDKLVKGVSNRAKVVRLYQGLTSVSAANGQNLQPITGRPNLTISKQGGVIVTFGTGRLLGINDLGTKHHTPQAIIGVRDNDLDTANPRGLRLIQANNLAQHTINNDESITEATQDKPRGWRLTLPDQDQGMRSITTPQIKSGLLFFTTQSTGKFSINDCGSNKGGQGIVNVETGRNDTVNKSFRRRGDIMGSILVLPPLDDENLDSYDAIGGTGTGVHIKDGEVDVNIIAASASNKGNSQTTPAYTQSKGRVTSGIISWREIQDNN